MPAAAGVAVRVNAPPGGPRGAPAPTVTACIAWLECPRRSVAVTRRLYVPGERALVSQVVVQALAGGAIALPPPTGLGAGIGTESGSSTHVVPASGLAAKLMLWRPALADTLAVTVALAPASKAALVTVGSRKVTTGGTVHQAAGVCIQAGDEKVLSLPSRSNA